MKTSALAVCAALCLSSYVSGSDIFFTSSPSTIRQLVTEDLTMRCSLKDSAASIVIGKRHILPDVTSDTAPSDVSFLQSIVISKSGVDVATVAVGLAAKVFDNSTGVQVTGQVPGSGDEKGYLQVSWKYPGPAQTGTYQCVISGIGPSGHVQTFRKTMDVAESEASLNDVVGYIQRLRLNNDSQTATIAGLKAEIHDLNEQMNNVNATNAGLKVEMNNLKTSNTDLKAEVNHLNAANAGMSSTITDIQTKQNTHVMFTAILSADLTVSANDTVVFNTFRSNIGGGYDTSTGIFTAPVAGDYLFDIHVRSVYDKQVRICLIHNNICKIVADADDGFEFQSGSNSINLRLLKGDTVKMIGWFTTSYLYGGNAYSSFSGHLVAVA